MKLTYHRGTIVIKGEYSVPNTKWDKKWAVVSFMLGFSSLVTGPLMQIPSLNIFIGLIQRLGMGLSLLWVLIVSVKMFLLSNYQGKP